MSTTNKPLIFTVLAECKVCKARVSKMILPHKEVDTPVFMPVGTQGTLKGMLPEQLEKLGLQIMLANTYHLGTKPGPDILKKAGGLHKFMNWNGALLTDSGGFQMVSLLKLAEITEEGVKFQSLNQHKSEVMLTPEHSIEIQNAIGADIIMQTTRWLDRCLGAHSKPETQSIFPIVQGTLYEELRIISVNDHTSRDVHGFAIVVEKAKMISGKWYTYVLTFFQKNKPRYLMGVGFAVDLVVCCALGVDMFDCVFPTRTARFGCALTMTGQLNLKKDFNPIDANCTCSTCQNYTRAYLHGIVTVYPVACHLLTEHNLAFQLRLMKNIRDSIHENRFPEFVADFMLNLHPDRNYPTWIKDSLAAVNINLL
ncbi:hypothetical protein NQ317_016028 [Molorchus minor]|uniref:tRNA-guanosine(34) queuine transglycosylase n=1 Tax=Molorchus minor TaxID=1323400 RepID=A0ABQ9J9Z2_9CUCU|nr:hypothetical protein NQ317_016028 [Molorchus minor]